MDLREQESHIYVNSWQQIWEGIFFQYLEATYSASGKGNQTNMQRKYVFLRNNKIINIDNSSFYSFLEC